MSENISIIEYIWRNCYQLVVWEQEHKQYDFPSIFGCGFILKDENDYVFITADHVIHNKDYEAGERTPQEYQYAIVNNICRKDLTTVLTSIYGFHSMESINFDSYLRGEEDIEVAMIPDLKDVAFALIKEGSSLQYPFKTHELRLEDQVIVPAGCEKFSLTKNAFAPPTTNKKYIVMGAIQNNNTGILWKRCNVIHNELTFECEHDEVFVFKSPQPVQIEQWEGLSGSPFFSEDGELIGMLTRVVEQNNAVIVLHINKITYYIDLVKKIENGCG